MFNQFEYVQDKKTCSKGIILKVINKDTVRVYFEDGLSSVVNTGELQNCRLHPDFSGESETSSIITDLLDVTTKWTTRMVPEDFDKIMQEIFDQVNRKRDKLNLEYLGLSKR